MENGEDGSINGITEYGYGFWSRFLWNGETAKLINKPVWMGLSRLSVNRDFSDLSRPGDRCLAIWVGSGYYHFTTTNGGVTNQISNINYDTFLDGQWIYIHFGYERVDSDHGRAKGIVFFPGDIPRTTEFPANVIHQPL